MESQPLFRPDLKEMILAALSGGTWTKRSEIVRYVCGMIEARGVPARQASVTTAVKKVLRQMKDAGEIHGGLDAGTFAHYRLAGDAVEPLEVSPADASSTIAVAVAATVTPPAALHPGQGGRLGQVAEAERTVGQGRQAVYCYFYEADRVHSKTKGLVCWPCKVGLAARDAAGRLREQGAITSRSAPAAWALEIKTDDAGSLERAIHRVLKYAGRQTTGGGAEWFLTTPQMVEAIYLALESVRCWPE
jgi:hypothetical protein